VALTPNIIQGSLLSARTASPHPFNGVNFDRLALGIGMGVASWAVGQPQNLALTGVATGLLGSGAILAPTSRLIVPPNPGLVQAALVGAGVAGVLAASLALVVSLGVSQAFTSAGQYTGPSATVGTGADVSKVTVSNPATLVGILNGTLLAAVGAGLSLTSLAAGLGNGIASLLLQGTGTGAVVGSPVIPTFPGAGPTFSTVV
jgi:hypothetical protein